MSQIIWPPAWQTALVGILGLIWALALVGWLGPDANWDLFNYHYYSGFMLAQDRLAWDIAPAQRQTYFNPLLDLPTYLLIKHLGVGVFSVVVTIFQALLAPLVWLLAHAIGGFRDGPQRVLVCGLVTAAAFLAPTNLLELGTSYADNTTGVLVLAALLALFTAQNRKPFAQLALVTGGASSVAPPWD